MKFTGQTSYISLLALLLVVTLSIDLSAQLTGGLDFNTDATIDTDNDNRWEDTTGISGFDFELDNSPAVNRVTGLTGTAGITAAYDFPGGSTGNEAGALLSIAGTGTRRSFQNAPGDWSNENVTIEIWFKPDSLTHTPTNGQILFEDGGGNGFGFFLNDNLLQLREQGGGDIVSFDISGISGNFIQAVGTFSLNGGANDEIELFVNGVSVGTDANNNQNDWSGGDAAAVGTRGGANTGGIGGGQSGTESFDGQIGIFRLYRNQILTSTEVANNFAAVTATDIFFDDGGAGSDWGTPLNWDTDLEPTSAQNAFIHGGLSAEVTQAGEVAGSLTIGSNNAGGPGPGTGLLTVTSGTLDVSGNMRLGEGGPAQQGDVTQNGGAVTVGGDLQFGSTGGGGGDVQLYDLNGGTLDVTGNIEHVGGSTRGHLYVDEPNALTVGGDITIQSFRVGDNQAGSATLSGGTDLTTTGTLLVGRTADGDLTLDGGTHQANNLTVSDSGGAAGSTLTLQNSAVLEVTSTAATALDVGDGNNSDGTIDINGGSTLTSQGRIDLGQAGSAHGEINVNNGTLNARRGLYIAGDATGASDAGTSGDVTVGAGGIVNVAAVNTNTEVGRGGTGTLTIDGGTFNQLGANIVLGQGAGADGTMTVNSGLVDIQNQLRVGNTGMGTVDQDGGTVNVGTQLDLGNVNNANSDGTYNISGGNLNVGDRVNSDLVIGNATNADGRVFQTGGNVTVSDQLRIAQGGGTTGLYQLTGDGPGVELTVAEDLLIGVGGAGTFTQTAGQVVVNDIVNIGEGAGGGQYTISGGSLDATTDALRVGQGGPGRLDIDGGSVIAGNPGSANVVVGFGAGAGIIDMTGGSLESRNNLEIARASNGTFDQSGGSTTVNNDFLVGGAAGTATASLSGGSQTVLGDMDVGTNAGGGSYTLSGGTLGFADTATDGTQTQAAAADLSTLTVGSNGTFNFTGGVLENVRDIVPNNTLANSGHPDNTLVQSGGDFVIGVDGGLNTDGTAQRAYTTITGNYDQDSGSLLVDIFGGVSHGFNGETGSMWEIDPLEATLDSDILEVTGDAFLDGTLEVDLNGFQPLPFAWYDVLVADEVNLGPNFELEGLNLFRVIDDPTNPLREILQVATPEPASIAMWGLIGLALGGFGYYRTRRQK